MSNIKYVGYGVDGYASGVVPDIEIVHKISMFEVNINAIENQWLKNATVVDEHGTLDDDGDCWITEYFDNEWIKVTYTAGDKGCHEFCLYGPLQPTI